MDALFEALPWDTDCFGFKVARWNAPVDADAIRSARPAMVSLGLRLVYVFTPGPEADPRLVEAGAVQVDRKVIYGREIGTGTTPLDVWSYPVGDPGEDLRGLAFASGEHSRFRTDPRMPGLCFEALYDAWITRSTWREIADEVLASGLPGQVEGMVTVREQGEAASIGLIAVDAAARGKGIGRGLVSAAESWARGRGARRMEVATQGVNQAACALYERCGYRILEEQCVYHLWIDPGVS